MVAGEVYRTAHLIMDPVLAKAGEDIVKGELVATDESGFMQATSALAVTSAVYVAVDSVSAASIVRKFRVVKRGAVYVKKETGKMVQGLKLTVGEAGAVKLAGEDDIVIGEVGYTAEDTDIEVAMIF